MPAEFQKPTYDDFLATLHTQERAAQERITTETKRIRSTQAARGSYKSGATVKLVLEAVRREFDAAISLFLAELQRFSRESSLDYSELRRLAYDRLQMLLAHSRVAAKPEELKAFAPKAGLTKYVDDAMAELDAHLQYRKRQFDIGMDRADISSGAAMNVLNVGTNNGAIQQGGSGNQQDVTVHLDGATIRSALGRVEASLADAAILSTDREKFEPDLATVRAQLKKSTLSQAILGEAGKSLRSISESITAGALTPGALAALSALRAALGVG
jgi:hypothetical protein